jgi:hypothetical protein
VDGKKVREVRHPMRPNNPDRDFDPIGAVLGVLVFVTPYLLPLACALVLLGVGFAMGWAWR